MASMVGGAEGTLTGTFFAVFYFQGLAGCGLSFAVLAFDANVTVVSVLFVAVPCLPLRADDLVRSCPFVPGALT